MISISDAFTDQYRSKAAFIEALCGIINIEMRQRGSSGASLVENRWDDGPPPSATIVAAAGQEPLTVAQCREWLEAENARRKKAAAA